MRETGESSSSSIYRPSTSISVSDCHILVHALQGLCASIQELASDPSNFVLHRTQCCCLSRSYSLAVRYVVRQVHHADLHAQENLLPVLSELYQAMLQGERFMCNCRYRDGWIKSAMLLAFSSEAQDVCLQDLVWCVCVIQKATGELLMADGEKETNIYGHINSEWAGTNGEEDLRTLQAALEAEIHNYLSNAAQASRLTNYNKNENPQSRLARFLLQKVEREISGAHGSRSSNALPEHYWVDPNEFTNKESIDEGGSAVFYRVEWCGEIFGQKEFFHAHEPCFRREAAIQSSLRHPNLLQLICCTTSKPARNKFSLVMEMMDMNLRGMIKERHDGGFEPPFPLLTAVDLMLQIAKGMEYLHSCNIMHRDLKSPNILVSKQVSGYASSGDCRLRAKVADFGISRATKHTSEFATPHVGSTYWMAPEVFNVHPECNHESKPSAKYTSKADVYSFAMVCYEILSGNIPFDDSGKVGDLYQRLIKGERPKLPSSCPPYLGSYIQRCWHGEPSKRPPFDKISRTLRHVKGILVTCGDPLSSLALSGQAYTFIEDNLEQMTSSKWTSPRWPMISSKLMSVSFEMSWYQVMERKFIEESKRLAGESKVISALNGPKRGRKKRLWSKLVTWIARKLLCRTGNNHDKELDRAVGDHIRAESRVFTYAELDSATDHFAAPSLIGQGGSGSVYKGTLSDGRVVAVKVMRERSRGIERGFLNELALQLGKLHHPNLVPFLGHCGEGESLMLVSEYMPRGDLGNLMHVQGLSWAHRYNIACGLAAALNYLHHQCSPQIVHRDVKPSNVCLDEDFNARLADFGIARPVADDNSHVTTVVMGTMGYIAPEYFMTLKLGPEADVYSFGVVVLELATGRRFLERNRKNEERTSVIHEVWKLYQQGMLLDAGDAKVKLESQYNEEKMKHLLLLGLACSQSNPGDRPTMSCVVQVLSGEVEPPTPVDPPYGMDRVRKQSCLSDKGPLRSSKVTNSGTDSTDAKGMTQTQYFDAKSAGLPADEERYWSMQSSDIFYDALP